MSHSHLAGYFPWDTLGVATVVDLGGSHGELCAALAAVAPNLHFIVQELPRTVQSVNRDALSSTVAPRIKFIGARLLHRSACRGGRLHFSADLSQLG